MGTVLLPRHGEHISRAFDAQDVRKDNPGVADADGLCAVGVNVPADALDGAILSSLGVGFVVLVRAGDEISDAHDDPVRAGHAPGVGQVAEDVQAAVQPRPDLVTQLDPLDILHVLRCHRLAEPGQGVKGREDFGPLADVHLGMPDGEAVAAVVLRPVPQEDLPVFEIRRHRHSADCVHVLTLFQARWPPICSFRSRSVAPSRRLIPLKMALGPNLRRTCCIAPRSRFSLSRDA